MGELEGVVAWHVGSNGRAVVVQMLDEKAVPGILVDCISRAYGKAQPIGNVSVGVRIEGERLLFDVGFTMGYAIRDVVPQQIRAVGEEGMGGGVA